MLLVIKVTYSVYPGFKKHRSRVKIPREISSELPLSGADSGFMKEETGYVKEGSRVKHRMCKIFRLCPQSLKPCP